MFSRLALRTVPASRSVLVLPTRLAQATPAQHQQSTSASSDELPLYRRPVRLDKPSPVRLGFIPEEWFQFFYKKTGVTGPYVFGIGLTTFLLSKEIYVLEHEFYTGLTLLLMAIAGIKKFGPSVAAYLDKNIDEYEQKARNYRLNGIDTYANAIETEKKSQWQAEGQTILLDAKRENVALQLEAAYRERLQMVFSEVKRRLDYQLETENIKRRLEQKHMVQWIVGGVQKAITPQQEQAMLKQCLSDLKSMAPH